jgi:DNA-directed RNA polymerase specialized sigma24 family protein
MDELQAYCARMLGDGDAATLVTETARRAGGASRMRRLAHAVEACRQADDTTGAVPDELRGALPSALPGSGPGPVGSLAAAVASELFAASARLPQHQQEALALRELLRLSHEEVASAIGIEVAAVAPLLARSRLRLRSELRGGGPDTDECPERERTLRAATLRQDAEPVSPVDDDWLVEHLGHCAGCGRAHAAMLEASVCYRGWHANEPAEPSGALGARHGVRGAPPSARAVT